MNIGKAKDFLDELGIKTDGLKVGAREAVLPIKNSNEFSRIHSKLSDSDLVDLDIEDVDVNEDSSHLVYLADDYDIYLDADYDKDEYTLKLEEVLIEANSKR